MMSLASCDTDTSTVASHDQKSHVAPHVICLGLRNAMVLLMKLLVACDAMPVQMAAYDPKNCCTSFQSF